MTDVLDNIHEFTLNFFSLFINVAIAQVVYIYYFLVLFVSLQVLRNFYFEYVIDLFNSS